MLGQRRFYAALAAVGGLVLLESLFLPWYRLEVTVAGVEAASSHSAWQTMSVMDVLLLSCALGAVAGGLLALRWARFALVALVAGAAGLVFSLIGLSDLPEADLSPVRGDTVEVRRAIGPFIALAASLGVAGAGLRAGPVRRGGTRSLRS